MRPNDHEERSSIGGIAATPLPGSIASAHDTLSKGSTLAGLRTGGGEGLVENVDLSDGGEEVSGGRGGTGLLVSHYHQRA